MRNTVVVASVLVSALVLARPVSTSRAGVRASEALRARPAAVARIAAAPAQRVAPWSTDPSRQFIDTHCTACHNDRSRTSGLSLDAGTTPDVGQGVELWEKVLHKVRTGQMPPPGRPRPDAAATGAFVGALAAALDGNAAKRPLPGRVGAHRLNRTEYANAIRDLLSLEIDTRALLLPDEADEGFDNVAASLALSPTHLERYLAAAAAISQLAVGDPALGEAPASAIYKVPRLLEQDVRVGDDAPFGSRGGLAIRHTFPIDGDYRFKIRLRRQVYDYIVGMGAAQRLDLRIDGVRVKRFTLGGEAQGTPGPLTWNGEIVGETSWELYMHAADAALDVRTPVRAGPHAVSASFVDSPWEPEGAAQPLQVDFGRGSDEQYDGYAAVDALTITGPYPSAPSAAATSRPSAARTADTPSRRAIFSCMPKNASQEMTCARRILSSLARRAYRRPPATGELQTLIDFYRSGSAERGFEHGIQSALERMLVSFNFLFRVEKDPAGAGGGTVYRLNGYDLASRLSFFIWSSIPDDELLDLAARGRLADAGALEQQVRRMLRDPRAKAMVDSFGSQWLGVRRASGWLPDPNIFPDFDENLRRAMLEETALFLDSQLRDDRSVLDLLRADYSFVNERLAQHYGVPGVTGERFRKVTFADGVRGGLLGQGSILMVTSYPDRTAPVLRGFWILENLLGMPPPPPPADVPDLEPKSADGRVLTMREQMEAHRKSPACAACHVRMDPLGFSLENFDAIGRWRAQSGGRVVDADAVFADGTPLNGAQGLRAFLATRRDDFVHTFAARLLTYALGRHVDYRDQPAIRRIVRDAAAADYRWSAIILGIVRSTPFQMRHAPS